MERKTPQNCKSLTQRQYNNNKYVTEKKKKKKTERKNPKESTEQVKT